jgi:hypothetical protein
MARLSEISEEGAAISRTEIEPFLFRQDSSLVVWRKLTNPELSRFTCSVPAMLRPPPKPHDFARPQTQASETAMLWVQNGKVMGPVTDAQTCPGVHI